MRHDHEVRIAARVKGRFELANHLLGRDHSLAGHVAAALGKNLVLDEQAGDPGPLIGAHRPTNVGDVAEAGIGIGEDRHGHGIDDPGIVVGHLDQAEQRGGGLAQECRRRRIAAAGDGGKARSFGKRRRQRVLETGQDVDIVRLDEAAKTAGGAHLPS